MWRLLVWQSWCRETINGTASRGTALRETASREKIRKIREWGSAAELLNNSLAAGLFFMNNKNCLVKPKKFSLQSHCKMK